MTKQRNEDKGTRNNSEFFRALAYFSHIGVTMAASVVIGVLLGKFLDDMLGTTPWLLLVFSLCGAGAAIKVMFDTSQGKK